MCGINLIFAYGAAAPPVVPAEIVRVRDAMEPRGPDDAGTWLDASLRIGMGHRRLSIIDPSPAGHQPMRLDPAATGVPEAASPVIVFNGEIYNFRALRSELEAEGITFATHSDTEVLLQLYRRDGAAMVSRLRGMYAFGIWDPARRGVLLARDPFGIKPLYIADDGHTLRVASQVKALRAGDTIDTTPDPAGHAGFFLFGYVPEPHTLYRDIRALPAGTTLWLDTAGARREAPFFDVTRELAAAAPAPFDAAALHDALAGSVAAHLVADVPVGVFLSAGLDSTAIAHLVREVGSTDLRTVTLAFEEYRGHPEDEAPLAERTAHALAATHTTRRVRREDFAVAYSALIASMDQPSINGVNSWFVARAAAESGLKVTLSGIGGDELFAGYPSFTGVPRLVGALGWTRVLPGLGRAFRAVSAPLLRHATSPKYAGLFEYATSVADAYLLRRALFMPWELPAVMDPEMAAAGWNALAARANLAGTVAGIESNRAAVTALELGWYMRSQLLRDADWAGMAHSLEIRTPFVDIDLFRALAPMLVGPHPPDKRALGRAPAIALPDDILNRPKTGFAVPVRDWLQADEPHPARGLRGWAGIVYRSFAP
jgi:asparagine synthase (glutamine-hydrolysing)